MYTETTTKQNSFIDLSKEAQKILNYIYKNATFSSPLEYCRIMQESATGMKYYNLLEVEAYLINE